MSHCYPTLLSKFLFLYISLPTFSHVILPISGRLFVTILSTLDTEPEHCHILRESVNVWKQKSHVTLCCYHDENYVTGTNVR